MCSPANLELIERRRQAAIAEIHAALRPKERVSTEGFLTSLEFYPTPRAIARLAGEIQRGYGKRGITLKLADSVIAAVALENKLTLMTANVKDFPIPELSLPPVPAR